MSKKELAINLSKLDVFPKPKLMEEQYPTDSEIAADITWFAMLNGDIDNKVIADLGAGTGILGIGCMILGAEKIVFVEKDSEAVEVLKKNLESTGLDEDGNYEILNQDIKDFTTEVDIVIQNPPFGTKEKHADTVFLEKAMNISNVVYSFHKAETRDYIEKFAKDKGWTVTHYFEFKFPLKQTMKIHKKKLERINVGCWRFEKD